jgi:glycosyltransferase involved in cell wall biosynthesis
MALKVSVVVCTYNRAELLRQALDSLVEQSADPELYEILVVDNNSNDGTTDFLQEFSRRHANCRFLIERQLGIAHARNRGFREAAAEWIVYFDSDEIAPPQFLERIFFVLERHAFDCFGGVYVPVYPEGKPRWFQDAYASNGRLLDSVGVLESGEISAGVGAFKKSVLEQFGGFPTRIGMRGRKIGYGEETLLQRRMRQRGFVIGFDPELYIQHIMLHNRLTVRWLLRSAYYHGFYYWETYEDRATGAKLTKLLLESGYLLLREFCCTLPRLLRSGYYAENFIFEAFRLPSLRLGQVAGGIKNLIATRDR